MMPPNRPNRRAPLVVYPPEKHGFNVADKEYSEDFTHVRVDDGVCKLYALPWYAVNSLPFTHITRAAFCAVTRVRYNLWHLDVRKSSPTAVRMVHQYCELFNSYVGNMIRADILAEARRDVAILKLPRFIPNARHIVLPPIQPVIPVEVGTALRPVSAIPILANVAGYPLAPIPRPVAVERPDEPAIVTPGPSRRRKTDSEGPVELTVQFANPRSAPAVSRSSASRRTKNKNSPIPGPFGSSKHHPPPPAGWMSSEGPIIVAASPMRAKQLLAFPEERAITALPNPRHDRPSSSSRIPPDELPTPVKRTPPRIPTPVLEPRSPKAGLRSSSSCPSLGGPSDPKRSCGSPRMTRSTVAAAHVLLGMASNGRKTPTKSSNV